MASKPSPNPQSRLPDDCPVCLGVGFDGSRPFNKQNRFKGSPLLFSQQQEFTLDNLRDMVDRGCATCNVLLRGIMHFRAEWELANVDQYANLHYTPGRALQLSLYLHAREESLILEFYPDAGLSSGSSSNAVSFQQPRHIPPDPRSAQALNYARKWIQKCIETHEICRATSESYLGLLPTRFLNVGPADGTAEPFLIDTTSNSFVAGISRKQCRYAALSHCWGKKQPLTTTRATIESRKSRIPWTSLPKTFQNVIEVTRKLGLRYLWIDSLCILQDDKTDWQRESARMASVYAGAHVTIAATHSSDGETGFLSTPRREHQIDYSDENSNRGHFSIFVRLRHKHGSFFLNEGRGHVHVHDHPELRAPLLNRGWCFQERLLSTRVVHFMEWGLVWECQSVLDCECGNMDVPKDPIFKVDFARVLRKTQAGSTDTFSSNESSRGGGPSGLALKSLMLPGHCAYLEHQKSVQQQLEAWYTTVAFYTGKKLTYESDKLPALAGVAQKMGSGGMGNYLAGLWEAQLAQGLLWSPYQFPRSRRSSQYIAPTFSWASLTGVGVSWDRELDDQIQRVHIIEAECVPKNVQSPFGEVQSGFIRLSGPLISSKLTRREAPFSGPKILDDECIGSPLELEIDTTNVPELDTLDEEECLENEIVFCLSLFEAARPQYHGGISMLLLRQADKQNTYTRCGLVNHQKVWYKGIPDSEIIIV